MSTSPGVTNRPDTSTTFLASPAGIVSATRAIFPAVIATSIRRLMSLRGSMTCPPLSSRSYCGCAHATFVKSTAAATIARRFISQSPCAGGYDTVVKRFG